MNHDNLSDIYALCSSIERWMVKADECEDNYSAGSELNTCGDFNLVSKTSVYRHSPAVFYLHLWSKSHDKLGILFSRDTHIFQYLFQYHVWKLHINKQ